MTEEIVDPGASTTEPEETPPSAGEGAEPVEPNEASPEAEIALVDDKFEFNVPENTEVDADVLKNFKDFAIEKGMSQDAAQSVLDYSLKTQADQKAAREEAVNKAIKDIKADPELGGSNYDKVQKAIGRVTMHYGGEDFKKIVFENGLNHDASFARFIKNLSDVLSEQPVKTTSQTKGISNRPKTPQEEASDFFKKD